VQFGARTKRKLFLQKQRQEDNFKLKAQGRGKTGAGEDDRGAALKVQATRHWKRQSTDQIART